MAVFQRDDVGFHAASASEQVMVLASLVAIKNTFINVEQQGEEQESAMRSLKSAPPSFRLAEKENANFRPQLARLGHAAGDEQSSKMLEELGSHKAAALPARRRSGRALPMLFVRAEDPPAAGAASPAAGPVGTPASQGGGDESPGMCKLRTAWYNDDDARPAGGGDESPGMCKLRTAGYDDDDAHPAARQLRALSASFFASGRPGGPPGLFWLPPGRAAAPGAAALGAAAPAPEDAPAIVAAIPPAPARRAAAPPPRGLAQAEIACGAAAALRGQVWHQAQDARGTRRVQEALDAAGSACARRALAEEFRGHVWEAAQCPHANYALQKAIMVLPQEDLLFIVDELPPQRATQAASQKCGCRVVQRLLERCPPGMMRLAIDGILADFASVARSPYGNYVAQHVTEYASEEQRRRAMRAICADVKGLAADPFGSAVIFGALTRGPAAEQEMLAQTLLREPGLLAFMATTRHGSGCARRCLQLLRGRHLACARQQLLPELACLKASRFGRFVAQVL